MNSATNIVQAARQSSLTISERDLLFQLEEIMRQLPVATLFVSNVNTNIYMNETAQDLLQNLESSNDSISDAHRISRIFATKARTLKSGSTALEYGSHSAFEVQIDDRYFSVESRWLDAQGLQGRLWLFTDVSDFWRREQTQAYFATRDSLTGMPNRRAFEQVMTKLLESSETFCLLLLDLDHFKPINDTHGHQVGDQILILSSQLIESVLRERDFAARYGGEEFAVLLPRAERDTGIEVAKRIRRAFESAGTTALNITDVTLKPLIPTCSIGVVERRETDDFDSLVSRADAMLYRAKRAGRNTLGI